MNNTKKSSVWLSIITTIIIVLILLTIGNYGNDIDNNEHEEVKAFKIISSTENKDLEGIILNYAQKNNININIDYAGTLDIMTKLNLGEKYDAVLASNSIWLYMLNDTVNIKNAKSTSINPVVFGIVKSKAEELGWINKELYMKDILEAITSRKFKI